MIIKDLQTVFSCIYFGKRLLFPHLTASLALFLREGGREGGRDGREGRRDRGRDGEVEGDGDGDGKGEGEGEGGR